MNADLQAQHYYASSDRHWDDDIAFFSTHGVCIVQDNLVLLARSCPAHSLLGDILSPLTSWQASQINAWYVHLMIGCLHSTLAHLHEPISLYPWVIFQRGTRSPKLHRIRTDKLRLNFIFTIK